MSSEYERKLVDMQYQMRENNLYLDDYVKDLNTWTEEIKKKEETLKTTPNSSLTTSKDLPPIRNFIEPPKPKKKSKKKTVAKPTSSSINSYDYRSWDKYNVDAECERIDNEEADGDDEEEADGDDEEEEEEDDDDDDDEEWQEEVLKKKGEYYKDCGNYQFKQKSYAQAIEFYTKAIECDPTSHIYFANRAQCQLFEQRYGACEADCTLAIQLDQNYLKAYYRRALARIELQKIEQARQDLEYVISREPANKDAKNKLEEVNRNEEIKRLGRIYPLHDKPMEKRSTKSLKRIEIEEIDTSMMTSRETTTKKKSVVIEEMDTTPTSSEPPPPLPQPVVPPPAPSQPPKAPPKLVPISTTIPTTGYQFKRDWSNFNNQLEQQSIYFNQIPPTSYKTIFSTGLDSSVFSRIILLWSEKTTIDDHLINSMYELRQTPRFDTQLSFLNNDDKQLLRTILQRLENEDLSNEKLQMILKTYRID